MNDAARLYRESAVRYASPVGLVVILYEEVIRSLRRAHHALQQKRIEQRCQSLTHAIEVVGYLQSVLDFEKGEDVAANLSKFYNLARKVIVECNQAGNGERLLSLAADFSNLAHAWQKLDREMGHPSGSDFPGQASTRISVASLQPSAPRLRVHGP